MAVDPDKAIEKLSEYREEAKSKEKTNFPSDNELNEKVPETPIRQFFLHLYKFNAVVAATLGFVILFTWGKSFGNIILWLPYTIILFGISFQVMKTIKRMADSNGRNSTIDDMFIVLVLMVAFFGYYLVLPVGTLVYQIIHGTLAILWILQIFYVNYRTPEMSGAGIQGGIQEVTEEYSTAEKIQQFLTKDRIGLILVSIILAIPLVILEYN